VKRSERLARWIGTGLGVIGGFVLGYGLVRLAGIPHQGWVIIGLTSWKARSLRTWAHPTC
jgi:uncharacterized membrane protein